MSISVEKTKVLSVGISQQASSHHLQNVDEFIWVVSFTSLEDVVRKLKIELLKLVQHSIVDGNKSFQ